VRPFHQYLPHLFVSLASDARCKNLFEHLILSSFIRQLRNVLGRTYQLLEWRDMKHRVNGARWSQNQAISNITNLLCNSIGSKELECQFLVRTLG
jgi:hypothetical protein